MSTLLNQVSRVLKPYSVSENGLISIPKKWTRISYDFRVRDKRILIDVHPKSLIKIHPEIALRVAKKDKKRSEYKKQLTPT